MQDIKKNKILNKKAVEGIGTLIIFIAMILVATVAAGVIIRTSSVLQEKAYVVGTEARQNIITSMEIFSVTANGDVTNHETREIIFSARVRAGSYPLQLSSTSMTFTTSTFSFGANLQHPEVDKFYDSRNNVPFEDYELLGLSTTVSEIGDLNADLAPEEAQIVTDESTGNDLIVIWLSGEDENMTIELGIDLDGASVGSPITADIDDLAIRDDDGRIWGFIQINGEITTDAELNGASLDAFITEFQFQTVNQRCTFENLIPERYYCSEVQIGDADTILEAGEVIQIKYKLLPENSIREDEEFQVKFIPKRGTITDMNIRTPDTIGTIKINLWP